MIIYVDTNVLIGLVDPNDGLHKQAAKDLRLMRRHTLECPMVVLTEAMFGLTRRDQRARLREFLHQFHICPVSLEDTPALRAELFDWLFRYADHAPDVADGLLCLLTAHTEKSRVWTYDSEFTKLWRQPDGSAVPMAVRR